MSPGGESSVSTNKQTERLNIGFAWFIKDKFKKCKHLRLTLLCTLWRKTYTVTLQFVVWCPDSLPYLSEWHTVPYSAYTQMKNTPMDQVFYWQLFLSYCSTVAMFTWSYTQIVRGQKRWTDHAVTHKQPTIPGEQCSLFRKCSQERKKIGAQLTTVDQSGLQTWILSPMRPLKN